MATAAEQARQRAERYSQNNPVFELSPFTAQYIDSATGKFAPAVPGNNASQAGNQQLATARSPQTINQFQEESRQQQSQASGLQNQQAATGSQRLLSDFRNIFGLTSRTGTQEAERQRQQEKAVLNIQGYNAENLASQQGLQQRLLAQQQGSENRLTDTNRITREAKEKRQQSLIDMQGQIADTALRTRAQTQAALYGAQGNIIGKLLGSINSGSPNYRYW